MSFKENIKHGFEDILKVVRVNYPNFIRGDIIPLSPFNREEKKYRVEQCIVVDDPRNQIYFMSDQNKPSLVRILRVVKRTPEGMTDNYDFIYTYLIDVIKEYSYDEWDEGKENGWYNEVTVVDPRKNLKDISFGREVKISVVRKLFAPLYPPNEQYYHWLKKLEVLQMYTPEEWDEGLKLYGEVIK